MQDRDLSEERLLLDELTEDDRAELEQAALADDEVFERLLIAEDELVDQRARGELSSQDRLKFDATLERSPRLQERVMMARHLAREADQAAAKQETSSAAGAVADFRRRAAWRWPALAAAALLVVFLTSTYRDLPSKSFELVLQPTSPRSEEKLEPGLIPTDVERLTLYLELELADDQPSRVFEVLVETRDGVEALRAEGLKPSRFEWGDAMILELPVEGFLDEQFDVRVSPTENKAEETRYVFYVRRP